MGQVGESLRPHLASLGVLVLSTPIHTLPALVQRYGAMLSPGALLCDLGSLKAPIEQAMLALNRDDIELLGIHPLYAPVLPPRGQNIAVVPTRPGPRSRALMDLLRRRGANVIEMAASDHDAMMALSQGLSHAAVTALGRVAMRRGFDLNRLATLSTPFSRCLLLLLGRMASFDADLYGEIQTANPLNVELLDLAIEELSHLRGLILSGERKAVTEYMASPRTGFGDDPRDIHEAAHALFAVLPDPTSDDPSPPPATPQDAAPLDLRKVAIVPDADNHSLTAFRRLAERFHLQASPVSCPSVSKAVEAIGGEADAALFPVETSTRAAMHDAHDPVGMARRGLRYCAEVVVNAAEDVHIRYIAAARRDQPLVQPSRTSILVELAKDAPGALYRMLAPFAIRKINLTRIASTPSRRVLGEYYFQLDFMGSRLDSRVMGAIADAERAGRVWIMGSYPTDTPSA